MATKKTAQPEPAGRPQNKGKRCSVRGCESDAKSKGMCLKHYTAVRREDPEVRAKANEASKRTAAKRRAQKADGDKRGKAIAGSASNGDLVVIAQTERSDIAPATPAATGRKPAAKTIAQKA